MEDWTINQYINYKHDLIRYQEQYKADFSHEINETDKIIRELQNKEIKHLKSVLWEHEQECKKLIVKIPKKQTR